MSRNSTIRAVLPCLGALLAVSGCADSLTSGGRAPLSLSFGTQRSASASVSPSGGASASLIPISNGGHTLDLTAASLLVSKVELETAGGDEIEQECDEGHGCSNLVTAPITIDLNPNGGVVTVATSVIPAGSYREIEVKFASVRLRGTYDAQAFDVTLPIDVEREFEFNPPLVVGGTGVPRNVTIDVPALTWLRNPDGTLIDPRTLATNGSLRSAVVNRIKATFKAYHDDDKDNDDDDH